MKIGVCDPDKFTFSQQLIDHWESLGHEVDKSMYFEPDRVDGYDVMFFDYASMRVQEMCAHKFPPKRVVVRAIDVENYMTYCNEFDWDKIDAFIVLNEAHKKLYLNKHYFRCPEHKIHVIAPGINPVNFKLKQAPVGKKAVFVGRDWIGKNVVGAIDVVSELNKLEDGWELHIRGSLEKQDPRWWRKYVEHRADAVDFPIHFDPYVEDMNNYLEDKDLMLVPSFKEAFSYAAAEATAKGIPALINNWYGADDVWPQEYIYNTPSEAALKYHNKLKHMDPQKIRDWTIERYDEQIMFDKIDALMKL